MATRKAGSKVTGRTQAWGIAKMNEDGNYELVHAALGRQDIRNIKRAEYPGKEFKTVKINATFTGYSK